MSNLPRKIIGVALVAIVAASMALAEGLPRGAKAPDFSLKDLSGKTFKLSANKGKVVFINFFATWCPPCRREFPEVIKLNEKWAKKGVKVISVSVDDQRTISRVKPFAEDNKAKHQVLSGTEAGAIFNKYANDPRAGIPMNFVIGKDGKVVKYWVGFGGEGDVREWEAAINTAIK